MQKSIFVAVIILFCSFSIGNCLQLEFSAGIAMDKPISKPLPGLSAGYGWAFRIGLNPVEKFGISLGINTTSHQFDAGILNNKIEKGDSQRTALFVQSQYCFLQLNNTEFEAYAGGSYNTISGGDSSGGYPNLVDINKDDIGYTGYGALIGAGVLHKISSIYFVNLSVRYVLLTYTKHQLLNYEYSQRRKGDSFLINLGIIYRIDFSRF